MSITLDYTFMLAEAVRGGVPRADARAAAAAFESAWADVERRRASGELGFLDLLGNTPLV